MKGLPIGRMHHGWIIVAFSLVCSTAFAADLSGREAVVWSPGGKYTTALEKAYIKPFEAETGAKITLVEADLDQAMAAATAQVRSNNVQWDALSSLTATDLPHLAKDGIVQQIDASSIPGLEKLPKALQNDYGVPVLNSVVTVSYRTGDNVLPLKSVKDFFDPSIKGSRTVSSLAGEGVYNCVMALLSDGVTPEELTKKIDATRCTKVFDKIKDQITAYWSNGSEMAQLMISDSVDYCVCRDGRILQATLANPEWKIQYKGGIQFSGYLSIVKGSKNADVINAFTAYMLDPKRQAIFTQEVGYSAPNPESVNYLPDNLKPFASVTPEVQAKLAPLPSDFFEKIAAQQTEIGKAWQAYVSK